MDIEINMDDLSSREISIIEAAIVGLHKALLHSTQAAQRDAENRRARIAAENLVGAGHSPKDTRIIDWEGVERATGCCPGEKVMSCKDHPGAPVVLITDKVMRGMSVYCAVCDTRMFTLAMRDKV